MVAQANIHVLGSFFAVFGRYKGHSRYAVVVHSGFYIERLLLADKSFGNLDVEFGWVQTGIVAGGLGCHCFRWLWLWLLLLLYLLLLFVVLNKHHCGAAIDLDSLRWKVLLEADNWVVIGLRSTVTSLCKIPAGLRGVIEGPLVALETYAAEF